MTIPFGTAQLWHIKKVRAAIDNDHRAFFAEKDWRNVIPRRGRYDSSILHKNSKATTRVDHFYIKPVAVWVPHLLKPNHVPCCPHCKRNTHVDVVKSRWINYPKVLYGIQSHKYLDTKLYPCKKCNKHFAGYNRLSMQLDATTYHGIFDFYVGHGYAVDEELFGTILEQSAEQSTASIYKRLKRLAYNKYYSDYRLYLAAVGTEKIEVAPRKGSRMTDFMSDPLEDAEMKRLRKSKVDKASAMNLALLRRNNAQQMAESDVSFESMLSKKDNHNIHGEANILRGLGGTKLRYLMNELQVFSMKQLQQLDPRKFPRQEEKIIGWQLKVDEFYEARLERLDVAEKEFHDTNEEYERAVEAFQQYEAGMVDISTPDNEDEELPELPPLFSKFDEKVGYNGKFLSKYRINSIVTSVFQHRKRFQECKMKGLCAEILKIDFNYKLARKIRVWLKQGASFGPYQCIVTIQNEEGMTVFWKALKHSESFAEIEDDLMRLRRRLNNNLAAKKAATGTGIAAPGDNGGMEEAVKVVYVDNCCTVRRVLARCFPGALVKLDVFHWLKRWNDIVLDSASAQAGIFRGLMSRAVFVVDRNEYLRAKEKLQRKKRREPTVKEILREATSVIPEPEVLRANVSAVLQYVMAKDAEIEHQLATRQDGDRNNSIPKKFLKSHGVRDVIRNQLSHCDLGCLTDPKDTLVKIFRLNPITGVTYVARGTNTNERDNFDLGHKILTATHIGIHRAERLLACFYEERNHSKAITRLGEKDHGTFETEKLLLLNSFAKTVGYPEESLPYGDVSAPSTNNEFEEHMGFSYKLATVGANVANPAEDIEGNAVFNGGEDEMEERVVVDESEDPVQLEDDEEIVEENDDDEMDVEEMDVEVMADYDQPDTETEAIIDGVIADMEVNEAARVADNLHRSLIAEEIRKLLPDTITNNESTLDAFKRLTNKRPWIPFRDPASATQATDVDIAEAELFHRWKNSYRKDGKASGTRGYKSFETAWNNEVSRRFTIWSNGGQDVVLIKLKSCHFLQEYFKQTKEYQSLQSVIPAEDDRDMNVLNGQFRTAQRMTVQQVVRQTVRPICYHRHANGVTPFGHPTCLNATVAAGVLRPTQQQANTTTNAPFGMERPPAVLAPQATVRIPVFRTRMYCNKCGFKRSEHDKQQEGVAQSCKRYYCGNCNQRKEFHMNHGYGPTCTFPTDPSRVKDKNEWYA
jgi:hypothetical protein